VWRWKDGELANLVSKDSSIQFIIGSPPVGVAIPGLPAAWPKDSLRTFGVTLHCAC